jgi:hypothetical protein
MGLFNTSGSRNTDIPAGYKHILCSTENNNYIPLYVRDKQVMTDFNDNIYYQLEYPIIQETFQDTKLLKNVIEGHSLSARFYYTKEDLEIYVDKGLIYLVEGQNIKILLASVISKEAFFDRSLANMNSISRRRGRRNTTTTTNIRGAEHYKLLIDPNVFTNSKYSRVMYYVKKYFIDDAANKGIEVVLTTDIKSYCFNPAQVRITGVSITEINARLNNYKNLIASTERTLPTMVEVEEETEESISQHIDEILEEVEEPEMDETFAVIQDDNETEDEFHILEQDGIVVRTGGTYRADYSIQYPLTPAESFNGEITGISITNITPPTADEFSEAEEPVANFELQNTEPTTFDGVDDFVTIADGTATWTMEETPETEVNDMLELDEVGQFPSNIIQITHNDLPEVSTGTSLIVGTGGEMSGEEMDFARSMWEEHGATIMGVSAENQGRSEEESGYGFTDDESQILNYGR